MSVYLIADIKVTDDGWIPRYAEHVHGLVARHGGKYLSRSGNITTLEGQDKDSTLMAILEFPTKRALRDFLNDPDYVPHGEARRAGSVSNLVMIDSTDIAGAIPYLPGG